MRRECRERFPRHRLQRKSFVNDPGMHHVTHVPWCMSISLTHDGGENVPGIPGACATRNIAYLVRGPWYLHWHMSKWSNRLPIIQALSITPWEWNLPWYSVYKSRNKIHKSHSLPATRVAMVWEGDRPRAKIVLHVAWSYSHKANNSACILSKSMPFSKACFAWQVDGT